MNCKRLTSPCFCAALDDAERVDPGHAFVGELTGAAAGGAK